MNLPVNTIVPDEQLIKQIQYNCDVSDARDHGIYSMCSLVLKLRNLYKWEIGGKPWSEPESSELLDWIEAREQYWQGLSDREFRPINVDGRPCAPDDVDSVNGGSASGQPFFYGAGHGRSMKAIFFLAEVRERLMVEDCPVVLLGREHAREMASPFAMVQEGQVVIRTDPLLFFLYDHIQELRSSCRSSLRFFLTSYGLLNDGVLDQQRLVDVLDEMASKELDLFIYHEIGELLENTLNSATLQQMIGRFPGSVIEFVCRAIRDVLADTHPRGVLSHILIEKKPSTLGLYVSFVDGLRQELFPELGAAWKDFLEHKNWDDLEQARINCRERTQRLARKIDNIAEKAGGLTDKEVKKQFNEAVLIQLGLEIPDL
ncbi:MAG: Sfum_1244 family protein [Desulfocapsaceae bacterium]